MCVVGLPVLIRRKPVDDLAKQRSGYEVIRNVYVGMKRVVEAVGKRMICDRFEFMQVKVFFHEKNPPIGCDLHRKQQKGFAPITKMYRKTTRMND